MKKIEAIIRPIKLEEVKEALGRLGVHGMTVTEAIGCGLQRGYVGTYRGTEFSLRLLPKVKLEIVVKDGWVEDVIRVISEAAATGQVGDGKIFVTAVVDAVRIRTGERGEEAL